MPASSEERQDTDATSSPKRAKVEYLGLVSSEGDTIVLERQVALQSKTIEMLLSPERTHTRLHLPVGLKESVSSEIVFSQVK